MSMSDNDMDIMLELVSDEYNDVDLVIGADTDVDPTDFDPASNEEFVLSMVDMLHSGQEVKSNN